MSITAYLRLIKPGETDLIFIYTTSANKEVAPYSISGVSVENGKIFLLVRQKLRLG